MKKLPLNFDSNLTEFQIGALKCKSDVALMIDMTNAINCSDPDNNIIDQLLLDSRTLIIADLVDKLGTLSLLHKGYIASLLELVEIESSGGDFAKTRWQPSLVTGKWQ